MAFPGAERSLRGNVVWTFLGYVAYAGSRWAIIAILAKLADMAQVGQYGLAVGIVAPVVILSRLSVRTLLSTDTQLRFAFGDFLRLAITAGLLALGVITGMMWASNASGPWFALVLTVGAVHVLESIGECTFGLFQQRSRMDYIASSQLLQAVLSLTLMIAGYLLYDSLLAAMVGFGLGVLLRIVLHDAWLIRRLLADAPLGKPAATGWDAIWRMGNLTMLGLPVTLGSWVYTLANNMPRYQIERFLNDEALGVYVAMFSLTSAFGLIAGTISAATISRLAQIYADGNQGAVLRLLQKMLLITGAIGAAGVATIWLIGPQLMTILYEADYASEPTALTMLMLSSVLASFSTVLGSTVSAMRIFSLQLPVHCGSLLLVTASCFLLTQSYGLFGAASAVCMAQAFVAVCYALLVVYGLRRGHVANPSIADPSSGEN